MVIDSIKLHTVDLTLRDPFVTATSTQTTRTLLLMAVASGDTVGWGECSADGSPYCRGEDADTARAALSRVAHSYIGSPIDEPSSATDLVDSPMAAAALEAARSASHPEMLPEHLLGALLAQADEFKRTIDAATKERAKITDFLGDLIEAAESAPGDIEELTVHGATVFTSKIATSRILNQSHIKSLFPDIAENAEMYVDSSSRKRLYK